MHKLIIGTAVAGVAIVTISVWQNRCDESCKVKEFRRQMVECIQPDPHEATKCFEKVTVQIERAIQAKAGGK